MPLLRSVANIILGSLVIYFILINIIDIPYRQDHIATPGNIVQNLGETKVISSSSHETISNKLPVHLDSAIQLQYHPAGLDVKASNDMIYEKDADFGSDQTNVAQFFSSNPEAFLKDNRHTAYVPDVNVWNEQGSQMYNDLVTMRPYKTLNASNFENPYTTLG